MLRRRNLRGDSGETLVELLITLIILGTGITSIMFALGTTIHVGSFNRTQGKANAALATASEYVRQEAFSPCGTWGTTTLTTGAGGQVPTDASLTVTVEGPENSSAAPAGVNPWTSIACATGLQVMKISVTAAGSAGITTTGYVVRYCHKPMNADGTCPS